MTRSEKVFFKKGNIEYSVIKRQRGNKNRRIKLRRRMGKKRTWGGTTSTKDFEKPKWKPTPVVPS